MLEENWLCFVIIFFFKKCFFVVFGILIIRVFYVYFFIVVLLEIFGIFLFKNGFIVKKIINYIIYVYIYWIFEVIYLGIIKIMEVYVNVN